MDKWNKLPDKVKEEIEKTLLLRKYYLARHCDKCESPIEQMILVHLLNQLEGYLAEYRHLDSKADLIIEPQKEVETYNTVYRIDIAITFTFFDKDTYYAIECDGHEFHEKTKEQAARDKKRDRDLMDKGYHVIRFTGSEIWSDASRCVWQIMKIIERFSGYEEYLQKHFFGDGDNE